MIIKRIGLLFVVAHGMLYFWTMDQLVYTYDAQLELLTAYAFGGHGAPASSFGSWVGSVG